MSERPKVTESYERLLDSIDRMKDVQERMRSVWSDSNALRLPDPSEPPVTEVPPRPEMLELLELMRSQTDFLASEVRMFEEFMRGSERDSRRSFWFNIASLSIALASLVVAGLSLALQLLG